ncbi:MAG: Smr/MutS family protein [candidate division WOR-3 bacterium]
MKNLSSVIGFEKLLEIISNYAESKIGKIIILNLNPYISKEKRETTFKWLKECNEIIHLLPSLQLLKKEEIEIRENILPGEELLYYKNLLELSEKTKEILEENKVLEELRKQLIPLPYLKKEISNFIEEDGTIKPSSTPLLESLYNEKKALENKIEEKINQIFKEKKEILQDKIVTKRLNRMVIPIKYERRNEIEGMIIDFSRTQNTAFVEPKEIINLNNRIAEIENEIEIENKRILKMLTDKTKAEFPSIYKNLKILGEIDALIARIKYAKDFKCIIPEFTEEKKLKLKDTYHPLLLREKKKVEPLNLEFGEKEKILLISGPNAGGKTVLLKTIGINVLSSLAGIPIPAKEGTKFGSFTEVLGIIEDEQSIEENLSSFSSYIVRLSRILEKADENTLILLDELGGNTDPVEGSAISIAILNKLKSKGSLVFATTHLSPLKFYAEREKGMLNGAMEYKNGPTYRLRIGISGGSKAIEIARNFGLPNEIIAEAKKFMNTDILKIENLIEDLSIRTTNLKNQEEEILKLKQELFNLKKEYETKIKLAEEEKERIIREAKEKADEIVSSARATIEKTIKEIKETRASKEAIKKYKKSFASLISKEEKEEKKIKTLSKFSKISYDIDMNVPLEISVRGMTQEEAWKATDKFLDKAILADYPSVRILHGKGSWILRNMLHKKLKKDKRVKSISTPPHYEGGEGVTIVHLK